MVSNGLDCWITPHEVIEFAERVGVIVESVITEMPGAGGEEIAVNGLRKRNLCIIRETSGLFISGLITINQV
jgi:hypothetical protein